MSRVLLLGGGATAAAAFAALVSAGVDVALVNEPVQPRPAAPFPYRNGPIEPFPTLYATDGRRRRRTGPSPAEKLLERQRASRAAR